MTLLEKRDLAARMAELARTLAGPRNLNEVLSGVASAALELIPGVDAAGVLLIGKEHTFETVPKAASLTNELHRLQMQFDEGPCVQAALGDLIVRTDDFREETRWPQYAPACVKIGVLSGLSFKLYTSERTAGALNLFGFQPNIWRGKRRPSAPSSPHTQQRQSWPARKESNSKPRCRPEIGSGRPRESSWNATRSTTCKPSRCCARYRRTATPSWSRSRNG